MIKLVTDENFDGDLLRGLVRRLPELDVVRVQDVGLAQTPDPNILSREDTHRARALSRNDMHWARGPCMLRRTTRCGGSLPGRMSGSAAVTAQPAAS